MTLHSMTGFGEASHDESGRELRATLRSVNHRQLDVRVALPSQLAALEPKVAALVKSELRRGRVDVRVYVGSETSGADAWEPAIQELQELAERHGLGSVSVGDVLRFVQMSPATDHADVETQAVLACVSGALDKLRAFRAREGASLQTLFEEHSASLATLLDRIEASSGQEIARHRTRITDSVAELLGRDHTLDPGRIEQEIVLLAERSDIAEEILRAREHVRALRELVSSQEPGGKGKRLDFLLQELIRETNTMASKSVSVAVTHLVVDAKTTVEQLREQAQNVE